MEETADRAIAIVGAGAVLPDAPNVPAFWQNVKNGRYSISEVTADRWDPAQYYDADHGAPDKTYSKIGGWVREHVWEPMKWHIGIPPRVVDSMDDGQKWAISCTREALEDYGYPKRPLDLARTAVIVGNSMAGERHYLTSLRIQFPEYAHELEESASFAALPVAVRREILREFQHRIGERLPEITEDTMPGELSSCLAGRIANVFNLHGPNFVVDAACASTMAAIASATEGLIERHFDAVIAGGIDRNMGAATFIKFCKIGALSASGMRPFAQGADGFVMGEGAVLLMLKRLADAERDQDKIYAVLRGIGGASDGKGKGITAPNPVGQKLSIERAWQNAGLSPATVTLIEGHGTSTPVGDVVEAQSLSEVLNLCRLPRASVALGSVKSNIGHLKSAAGAVGLLKVALALREQVLPPSVHCDRPNAAIDFDHSPLRVNTELRPWTVPVDSVRRAGVSAFGFGGTNFHAVMEEYIPHRLNGNGNGKRSVAVTSAPTAPAVLGVTPGLAEAASTSSAVASGVSEVVASVAKEVASVVSANKAPLRGALVIGAQSASGLAERLHAVRKSAEAGNAPEVSAPDKSDLRAPERVAIDYSGAADLADKSAKALKALAANEPAMWKALRPQGIFRGHGPAPKVAFLYTGQGSQYVNMLKSLRALEPIVAQTFDQADRCMSPLLGKALSSFIFVDQSDPSAVAKAEEDLRQTAITQPAVLAADMALTRLLAAYGVQPDMTMGHSLGEYGALIAAGALPFEDALEAVSARGREMTRVSVEDTGKMAAVFAPLNEIERILKTIQGYVVIANINSERQVVIGGASKTVEQASEALLRAGYEVVPLPVSHAFHTSIVAPASEPLRQVLSRLRLQSPSLPIVANVDGEFYPTGTDAVPRMLDILARQLASPVQFIKGLRKLYDSGVRAFVEVGPKKALQGFVEDVLGSREDVVSFFTNHPKVGDVASFNQALCGLYAAGLGEGFDAGEAIELSSAAAPEAPEPQPTIPSQSGKLTNASPAPLVEAAITEPALAPLPGDRYTALGRLFADVLDRGWQIYHGPNGTPAPTPVTITGAALGLPGTGHIFDDANVGRILRGEQFIDAIPARFRSAMLDKHITRLVKSETGGAVFETIQGVGDVIKLAGRGAAFDLEKEFGVPADRLPALDRATQLAIGAGLDALRDAGIPLVMRYKTTTKGTQLPDRWGLPDALRDDTGVIFASAFPGYDSFAEEASHYYQERARSEQLATLEDLRRLAGGDGHSALIQELDQRIGELRGNGDKPYVLDRRFLFRILPMGHSQFAEFIGARGPNTHVNAACASTTQAVAVAEDWIRAGRCRRVIVVAADDITSDHLIEWMGAGFLATGAAATDGVVEEVALPFDRRRHGMIIGMGAAALVVENADAARERGIRPICEVLSAVTANSAFHGTRLDVQHICEVMERLVVEAETRSGIPRRQLARKMAFVSHETYTPARGGSAAAEIHALRRVFGEDANQIVIANTKGFTGHAMGAGIEDVVAVKALETGCVPPVANFKEIDPELGALNLSKGDVYPIEYALRLGAGFGSQISMTLLRCVPAKDGVRPAPNALGYSYRIADQTAWSSWLRQLTGGGVADLEIVNRTLRVRAAGMPAQAAEIAKESQPVTPSVVAQAPVAAPLVAAPPVAEESVEERVLAIVAEKTGYPKDMLDLGLDLEADLGIDTVKQAEMFTAIREIYGIPRDENLKLRDFPTLAHVIRFASDRRPGVAAVAAQAPAPIARAAVPPATEASVEEKVLAIVAEKTGYPKDMLDLGLDLEADLGIDTVKQAEMFTAIRETYSIPRDENLKLRDFPTLAHVIRFASDRRPGVAAAAPPAATEESVEEEVLAIVAEKTGYPKDMLDLGLDLEADLGIDTVKQAEMFTAIRETYGIPRDENLKLRDFPTLAHVIRFASDRRPGVTAVAAQPPAPVVAARPVGEESVEEKVLAIVAEKTGYPKDMLDLGLDLEADLGIDTVKQAEMFTAIRETYGIPRDENLKLRDFPTLAHVIRFASDRRPGGAAAVAVPPATDESVEEKVLSIVAEKTGYPKDMLDLGLDLEADLGIDTVKQAEMFTAIREIYGIPRDENLKLRDFPTLAHVIRFASDRRPGGAAAVAVPPATDESVEEKVLSIVAEKTGYPKDMLDLGLDLEADLGIDTVKQAEMFTAIREIYGIPRDENLKLRDFPTLAHVIRFAKERGHASVEEPRQTVSVPRPVLASLDAANSIPRRVPVPKLRPPLGMCKPTGVTLGAGSRVILMADKGGVAESLAGQLQTLGVEVLQIDGAPPAEWLASRIESWLAGGPIQGVYWLPALDNEGNLCDMDLATWREAVRVRVKLLYAAMRTLYEQVAGPGTFLVSATMLGGQHGYDDGGAVAPLGGAVTGFTKTYKRERMDALVKAVDFAPESTPSEIAEALVQETLRDPGVLEIGYKAGLRWTVGLEEQPAANGQPGLVLNKDTVFLITGAAGSIVSAITADLAAASGGTFYLIDLIPEPDPNDPNLKLFISDKEGLKRDLFARIQASGERATPARIEKELAALERAQAARSAIDTVRAAGGTAHYFSADLTDAGSVAKVIQQVRERSGRIDVLVHGAGMERSHFLRDKEPREFDLVFDVKSDGWFNLLHAIGGMPLGAVVAFSSVAARFGNAGQADYSSANDLLCKIGSSFRATRPSTRSIAIDWTAWGGIGMATRGSIPKMMELAGIDMLPPEAGIPLLRRELTEGNTCGELVVGQRLGILLNELDPTGGVDTGALDAGPMAGKLVGMAVQSVPSIETTLDPAVQPFLYDHQIDGTAVLPGVMAVEAFAEAALCVLSGWFIDSVEDVKFQAPLRFYRNEPRTVSTELRFSLDGSTVVTDCRLTSSRNLPNRTEPLVTTHFTGRVRLKRERPMEQTAPAPSMPAGTIKVAADIYRLYFHGPAYRVLERAWADGNRMVGQMAAGLPTDHQPSGQRTPMAPRLLELCFQTVGLWELDVLGRAGLPDYLSKVSICRAPELAEGTLYAVVTPDAGGESFAAEVVDTAGNVYVRLSGYRAVSLINGVSAEPKGVNAEPKKEEHAAVA